LVKMAMVESRALAKTQVKGCWCSHLARCLQRYDVDILFGDNMHQLDVDDIVQKVQNGWWQNLTSRMPVGVDGLTHDDHGSSVVRAQSDDSRSGFKQITYFNWFANDEKVHTRFWFHLTRKVHINNVAQFRLGSHWLCVETDRFVHPHIPRSRRLCKCCEAEVREDELHFVLGCTAYAHLRQQASKLFGSVGHVSDEGDISQEVDCTMKALMNPPPKCTDLGGFWKDMAVFLSRCKNCREQLMGVRNRAVGDP